MVEKNVGYLVYSYLESHVLFNVFCLLFYGALMILPHAIIGTWIIETLFQGFSRTTLNQVCFSLGILLLLLLCYTAFQKIQQFVKENRRVSLFYFLATLGLMTLAHNTLIIINTELVHFGQYALFAFLLFPLIKSYWSTLYWATLIGAIDEAYQYWYLTSGRPDYFDFNDILLDLLGAALGLCVLRFHQIPEAIPKLSFWKSKAFLSFFILMSTSLLLYFFGYLALYPTMSQSLPTIHLMIEVPTSFWTYDPHGVFHIVRPLEGVVLICLLLIFYCKI